MGRVWSFRDVTERRQVEEGIEQTLSLLKATLEATADGILVVDSDGRDRQLQPEVRRDVAHPARTIIASRDDKQALAFVLDQLRDPERFVKKIQDLYEHPEAPSYDWLDFKDERVFERYSHPQKIGGKTVGRVWSFHDVTRHAPHGGHDAAARAGVRPHQRRRPRSGPRGPDRGLEPRRGEDVRLRQGRHAGQDARPPAAGRGRPGRRRTCSPPCGGTAAGAARSQFVRKDGSAGVADIVVVPLFDDFGRVLAALAVCRDVTDRKGLERLKKDRQTNP